MSYCVLSRSPASGHHNLLVFNGSSFLLMRRLVRDQPVLTALKEGHSVGLSGHVRQVLGSLLLTVDHPHVGPGLDQEHHTLPISVPGGHVQRAQLLIILGVDVSPV